MGFNYIIANYYLVFHMNKMIFHNVFMQTEQNIIIAAKDKKINK